MIYNAAFLAPVTAILLALLVLGDAAKEPLARFNRWVVGHWPHVLAGLAALIGVSIFGLGLAGLLTS